MIASNPYALGQQVPVRVEEPPDAEHVAASLASADGAGAAVVIFGGGTLQSVGNGPQRYDVALSLRRLDRVLQYDPRELTIGLEAGATLASVNAVLAQAHQFIPFDAPLPGRATVGGTLAGGWAGPRRATYGHLRDLLIGSTVALTDGSLANAGGMVVKNVTGYDMSKVYIGSLGTLGAIVRANFKTLPLPAKQRAAVTQLSADVKERALDALGQLTVEPTAALLIDGFAAGPPDARKAGSRLFIVLEGSIAVVDRATRELRSALGRCGIAQTVLFDDDAAAAILQQTIDASIESVEANSLTYRSTGVVSDVWQRSLAGREITQRNSARCDSIVDLCTGDVMLRLTATGDPAFDVPAVDSALRQRLPTLRVLAGDPRLRAQIDAWGTPPSTMPTLAAVKERFDPNGTLAPGRYVGGL